MQVLTALRKIISISVRILLFSTFYNYSCFMLYTRARYERGPIIDRLNLLCSSETIKSRRVFRNRKIVQLSNVLIHPRFCLLDESLGEKLYDCRTTVRQRETLGYKISWILFHKALGSVLRFATVAKVLRWRGVATWVNAFASNGLQDDLITIAIDKENSLPDDKA